MPAWVWFALGWLALMVIAGPVTGRRLRRISARYPEPDRDGCPPQ